MNILQVMGCTSNQYASMERYLVHKAGRLSAAGGRLTVIYENTPVCEAFIHDFVTAGGSLVRDRMTSYGDLGFFLRLRRIIKTQEIDLVHAYFTPTCHAVGLFLRTTGLAPVVRTAANLPIPAGTEPTPRARRHHQLMSRLVSRIICRSEGVREAYAKLGIPSWKLAVADGGCDTTEYRFRPDERRRLRAKFGATDSHVVLGVSCRLVPVKRLDRLLLRFSEMAKALPDLLLWIAGDGPERQRLEQRVRDLGMDRHVRFLGHQQDMAALYSAVDIFCLSSEAEGMSNSLLEAMASERPVLVSDIPPNRDVVVTGRGGYLVDFDSPGEVRDTLLALKSREVRDALGRFNRIQVETRFSLASRITQELDIYHQVLERRS